MWGLIALIPGHCLSFTLDRLASMGEKTMIIVLIVSIFTAILK